MKNFYVVFLASVFSVFLLAGCEESNDGLEEAGDEIEEMTD